MGAAGRTRKLVLLSCIPVAVAVTAGCGSSHKTASSNVILQVSAPQDGASMNTDRITVRGTVTPADATVQVLGKPAQVGNGVFVGSVALHPGSNAIDIVGSSLG